MSAWIEVLYGQDLSRLGLVAPGIYFTDVTLWARLYSLHGHPISGGHVLPVGRKSEREHLRGLTIPDVVDDTRAPLPEAGGPDLVTIIDTRLIEPQGQA